MSKKLSHKILVFLGLGFSLTMGAQSALAANDITVNAGGTQTFTQSQACDTATLNGGGKVIVQNGSTLTINTKLTGSEGVVELDSNGTLKVDTIDNTDLSITSGTLTAINTNPISHSAGALTLNGVTISSGIEQTAGSLTLDGVTISKGINQTAGSVTLNNANTVDGKLEGAGTFTNKGTLTVANAANLAMTNGLTNSGTVDLGAGTLDAKISGGTLNINGSVFADADFIAAATTVTEGKTLTLTADSVGDNKLTQAISGKGNVTINGGTVHATTPLLNTVGGTLTVSSSATLEFTDSTEVTLSKAITDDGTVQFGTGTYTVTKTLSGIGKIINGGTLIVEDATNLAVDGGVNNTSGTIDLGGGTASILGATITKGDLNIKGDVTAVADRIAADNTEISSGKTLTLTGGTLGGTVTGAGTLAISDSVSADADYIAAATTVVDKQTLTLTGSKNGTTDTSDDKLTAAISGKGNVTIGSGTVNAALAKFTQEGNLTVDSGATLALIGGYTLERNIFGYGTTKLASGNVVTIDPTICDDEYPDIAGTLAGNYGTLDMTGDSDFKTFTGGTLAEGTLGVKLDVDLANYKADQFKFENIDSDATINIMGVNITSDFVNKVAGVDIAFITSDDVDDATYTQTTSNKVLTGKGVYTFTGNNVDDKGSVHISLAEMENVFAEYLSNENGIVTGLTEDQLTLASDYENKTKAISVGEGHTSSSVTSRATVNLQGYAFTSKQATTITVGQGKSLSLTGSNTTKAGSVDKNTSFDVAGGMDVYGSTEINGGINNSGAVFFNGETTINGALTGDGTYTNKWILVVANAGNLQMDNGLTNDGTVILGGGTTAPVLVTKITGGSLIIDGLVLTEAENINGVEKIICNDEESTGVLTLKGGELTKAIVNHGEVKVDGNVTMSDDVELTGEDGTLTVESGTLVFNNKTADSIENNVTIKAGAKLDPNAEVFKAGTTVTDYGTLEIDNAGTLAANVIVYGSAAQMVLKGGTIALNGGSITQTNGSSMKVEGNNGSTAVVTGVGSLDQLNVSGGTLTMSGDAKVGDSIKLVEGAAASEFVKVPALQNTNLWNNIVMNNVDNTNTSDYLTEYFYDNNAVVAEVRNVTTLVEANTNGLAGVQQGALAMTNQMNDKVADQMSLTTRPAAEKGEKYAKQIWASYIGTKEDLSDRELWNLKTDNTAKYKGAIVGVDFFSSEKAIAGVALSYATGDITANTIDSSRVQNDSKYYGVSLYDRVTNGPVAFTYDIGYQNGKNEISTYARANSNITADVKTNLYTIGARVERAYTVDKNSTWAPFVSLRYTRLNTGDYTNSNGAKFDSNSQNLFIPKLGVAWKGNYGDSKKGYAFNPVLEVGYMFNMGSRNAETSYLSATGHAFNTDYDIVDSGSFYGKVGLNLTSNKFTFGVDYRYLKGSTTKNSKWNVNLAWSF